ncbi:hypothetical protein [Pediococcus pentosaceus]|uniref:hypothetical protein n=1 Tax=Pediococcus pentosaceus TaxID=1255 RepID=UPI0015A0CD47|nr:hypothetical protein [Pediococcus pentosaceus]MCS8573398.1 hypothetical protein [Pediococcus pentosaceus]NVZ01043.1 hypothetical protein [Pediococcus pentosaceus]
MELLSKLDEEATKENAKEKLSKYRKYKSYINAPINPKITASFGDGGSSSTAPIPKYAEQRMIKAEEGRAYCAWIDWAINSCRKHKYRELLKIVYCEGYEEDHGYYLDTLVQRLPNKCYGMSSSTYFSWHGAALLDVAERLGCQEFIK